MNKQKILNENLMKKKTYILCVMMSLCRKAEAQNTGRLIAVSLKAGPIFLGRAADIGFSLSNEEYNKWNIELSIEENKWGIGLTARYITGNITRYAIPNPFFQPLRSINRLQVGDIVRRSQNFSDYSFMINKKLAQIADKHRFDIAVGTQLRKGNVQYFQEIFGWEIITMDEYLDKYGFISRLGYTYMISKHVSLSTNVEHTKFKKEPSDFFDFNVLVGVRF